MSNPELRKLAAGVLLVTVVLFGQQAFGWLSASGRVDAALRGATEPLDVVVVLDFTPERFHTERLADYGTFSGRDGAINRIQLRYVTPQNLRRLSNLAWVARIEPSSEN